MGKWLSCFIIGMALLGGSGECGYDTWEDVGADPIETDDGYEVIDTYMELLILPIAKEGVISPNSFLRSSYHEKQIV